MTDGDRQPLSADDWTRLAPEFAAASAHRRVSWAWVEPEARGGFAAGLGYLRSAAILVPAADSAEGAIAHPSEDDDPSCAAPATGSHRLELHAVHSATYGAPMLLLQGYDAAGAPWAPAAVHAHVARCGGPAISQAEHPALGVPMHCVHPCRTAELMRDVLGARGASAAPLDYVTAWWSVVAPLVGAPVAAREFAAAEGPLAGALDSVSLQVVDAASLPTELQLVILTLAIGEQRCRQLCVAFRSMVDGSQASLSFVKEATAPAIRARVARCPVLRRISVRGVIDVDDDLVAWLLQQKALTSIDLSLAGLNPNRVPMNQNRLTAEGSLPALRAFGGEWRADGCFWLPSPLLSPQQVLICQILALRMHLGAGAAATKGAAMQLCFNFASPRNQHITGPIARFSEMIRLGYPEMLSAQTVHFVPWEWQEGGKGLVLRVAFELPDGCLACYVWFLGKQPVIRAINEEAVPPEYEEERRAIRACERCWMTESVLHDHEADATSGSGGDPGDDNGYIVGQIYAKNWMRIMRERAGEDFVTV